HEPVRLRLQLGTGAARNDTGHAAAVGEVAVRRVDDGVHRLGEQIAAHDLEAPRRRFFFCEDLRLRGGTFAPARRASESPMAMACLRLFTFLPERPLFNVPRLRSRMAFATFFCAFLPYFAIFSSSSEAIAIRSSPSIAA